MLESIAGTTAINATIREQIHWRGGSNTNRQAPSTGRSSQATNEHDGVLWNGSLRGADSGRGGTGYPYGYEPDSSGGGGSSSSDDDPYAKYAKTCTHGDLRPVLPRIAVERTTQTTPPGPDGRPPSKSETAYSMTVDYSMLSVPVPGIDDLYKKWPSLKSHLGEKFPISGPYCYGNDPRRAYTIRLSYDSAAPNATSIWRGTKGCQPPWPCWKGDSSATPAQKKIPTGNHSPGAYVLDPMGLEFSLLYGMGFLLVVSLVFNYQLANRLARLREPQQPVGGSSARGGGASERQRQQRRPQSSEYNLEDTTGGRGNSRSRNTNDNSNNTASNSALEEPLLNSSVDDDELLSSSFDNPHPASEPQSQPKRQGVEESKQEAERAA